MKLTRNTVLTRQKLFDATATDEDTSVVGAKNTNLNNLNNVKYKWAKNIYDKMREENYWTPKIVDLAKDDKSKMDDAELEANYDVLGFLVFLDSLQSVNLPNIIDYISNPEIRGCLIEQTAQEFLHSESYQTIFTTLYTKDEVDKIYYRFKENEKLLNRTKFTTDIYQSFVDEPTLENFIDVLIANILLEAMYFYMGFNFFYYLSSNNKMEGQASMIRLINIDEKTHIGIFAGIINAIKAQADDELKEYIKNRTVQITQEAMKYEIDWSVHTFRNIPAFTETDINAYIQFIAEKNVLNPLGYTLFEDVKNPYKHLEKIANLAKGTDNKGNFFESNSNSYIQVSAIEGYSDY